MPSKVISDLKKRGRPVLSVAIGVGKKPPGGPPDASAGLGPDGGPMEPGAMPPDGGSGEQDTQQAYEQGMEALQKLVAKWPKFAPVLQQFEKTWGEYQQGMGGGRGLTGPEGPGASASAGSAAEQAAAKQE